MYLYLVTLAALLIWALKIYAYVKRIRKALPNISGTVSIGELWRQVMLLSPKVVVTNTQMLMAKHGKVLKIWLPFKFILISGDLELNEQVLANPINTSRDIGYQPLNSWFGPTMTKGGELWHSRRKIVTPAFGFKLLEGFVEIFDRQSTILLDCLGEQADGKTPFNIYPLINSFNLDVIVETSMGIQLNTQTKKGCVYTAAVEELTEIYGFRLSSLLLHFETIFSLRHPFKWLRQRKLQRIVHDFSQKVIRQRRALLENSRDTNLKDADRSLGYGNKRHYAVLDTLLQATLNGQSLADDVIREEVDKVMFAGHDTTATALSFGLHLLARHPRVQKKILEEIFQVYGELESSMRFSLMNLNELKYLECVIKEVLRLYPSVPIIARIIEQDLKYKHSTLGEGIIPAGTNFIILVNGSPTSGDSYPNPDEFFPERHENADDGGNTNYGRPFSAGPRNCFGQKFAMYNMKVALVRIIRRYELLPLGEKVRPLLHIVLRSENGMQLGMRKRCH